VIENAATSSSLAGSATRNASLVCLSGEEALKEVRGAHTLFEIAQREVTLLHSAFAGFDLTESDSRRRK